VLLLFIVNEWQKAGEKFEIVNSAGAITSRDQKAARRLLFARGRNLP